MSFLENIKLKLRQYFVYGLIQQDRIRPLSLWQEKNQFFLLFEDNKSKNKYQLLAKSHDAFSFETIKRIEKISPPQSQYPKAVIVDNYSYNSSQVMYFGDRCINLAFLQKDKNWQEIEEPLIMRAKPVEVANAFVYRRAIILLFYEKDLVNGLLMRNAHLAFFDKAKPQKLLYQTKQPIWEQAKLWPDEQVEPIGTVEFKKQLISYWYKPGQGIFAVVFTDFLYEWEKLKRRRLQLVKHPQNPILAPLPQNSWEAFNTFNPAAVKLKNEVHLLYRAQGYDYVSSIGYAHSRNGYEIDHRSQKPIFAPRNDFEINKKEGVNYDFISGGSYGGCEDPRITRIGNKIYMTYVTFDGWSPPRLALTSILVKDFLQQKWLWSKPVLISPPGVVDKSGCLLPEKINGKYVFFHRVFPNILIDYVDNLNFDGKSRWLKGQYSIKIRPDKWDSRKIGAGAPPIKTKDGWLLIYYGVDDRDDSKYHIGAMLLDLKNPAKVLSRPDKPILQPDKDYENNGFKPGITYPCGAVVMGKELLVYYGAADSVVCVAKANLNQFLTEIKENKEVRLARIEIKEVSY